VIQNIHVYIASKKYLIIVVKLIHLLAGVVDEDYRGNLGVVLFNHSEEEFKVNKGDRIAQLICERIIIPEILEVKVIQNLH
jgi:dUTP pyrophosphatase